MIQDAWGWCTRMTQRDGTGREVERGSVWGTHVYLWRIHVDVWQNQFIFKKKNYKRAPWVAQMVKNLPAMWEAWFDL